MRSLDEKRDLVIPGDYAATLTYCVQHIISLAKEAIADHGAFYIALSGGSTPKAIYEKLTAPPYSQAIDWEKVHLFWSDERSVSPESPESNYHMAMHAGLGKMPIPPHQIHRMVAEEKIDENAHLYEKKILSEMKGLPFDLVMLGMGEDGHTASLFPQTEGLHILNRSVIANYIPEKKTWRMTLTFECINKASHIAIYVLGASKKETLSKVLGSRQAPETYPILQVGSPLHKALWIADSSAAEEVK